MLSLVSGGISRMKKKYLILAIAIFLFAALVILVFGKEKRKPAKLLDIESFRIENIFEDELVWEGFPSVKDESEVPLISVPKTKALEDYIFMWNVLYYNSPTLRYMIEQDYGIKQQIIEGYIYLETLGDKEIELVELEFYLRKALDKLNQYGHIGISTDIYNEIDARKYFKEYEAQVKLLDNLKTKATYNYLAKTGIFMEKEENEVDSDLWDANQSGLLREVDAALIHLPSFQTTTPMGNSRIEMYRKQIEDSYDKQNIILDLRGNGGGNTMVWIEGVVHPIIKEKLKFTYYSIEDFSKMNR